MPRLLSSRLNLFLSLALFLPLPARSVATATPPATAAPAAEECCEPSPIVATDLLKVRQLSNPALSPDGRLVAYVVRSIEPKPDTPDDWVYQSQVWVAGTDGSSPPRQLTRTGNNTSPAWSPDGTRLAFVRTLEKEKPQVYLLPLAGGDPQALTRLETGATNPRWSPDGTRILVSSTLDWARVRDAMEKSGAPAAPGWSPERPGREPNDTANWGLKGGAPKSGPEPAAKKPKANPDGTVAERREWLARNEADGNPRVTSRLNLLAETDLRPVPEFAQLFIVPVGEEAAPQPVAPGFAAYDDAQWLADGRSLVCTGPRQPAEHPDRDRLSSLWVIDLAGGTARVLLERPGENYADPLPSPDGRWIAFTSRPGGEITFEQPRVAVLPAGGGEPRDLTPTLDRPAANLRWSADSTAVYFTAADRGRLPLFRVPVAGGEPVRLTASHEWGIQAFDAGAHGLAQVVTHPGNPWELHVADPSGANSRPLTSHNSGWLAERTLATLEPHRLATADGLEVDYWTIRPANFDPAKKYPLLLQIHGGPSAMWGPGEASMWHEFQYYAARGYVVVFANPRGSGGYGRDFQRANYRDWGAGPASDVLGAAEFVAREPWVDRRRQVVTGGSYGGYLTAWIVAHDRRFKAAVAQRGVYDLRTFFGEGTAWFLLQLYFGGLPWEEKVRPILDRESPLTYVADIATPLLIQHGDVDYRTGVIQSQMLYKSLKALGRPVEYARYPRASHEMSRSGEPKQRLDSLVRYEEFFRRFIGAD